MSSAGGLVQRSLRWGALGLATLAAFSATDRAADARGHRHHRHHVSTSERYAPSFSSMVVDANSGAVLQATSADSPRHPASLTKIMTLYLLFERLEAGKIKMSTELPVSAHAAAQAPSKLGLKPGQSIDVDSAIRAIVTRSANDVAVVVAEALGGSEENFARLMTAKAQALGMMHTVYRDASGLPTDAQITTARDMSILARAIQDRFPQYYHYFSIRTFVYRGEAIRNHNHLLGRVAGVDGMKTGYIHDSGFNIVVSMRRGGRHIIAVVFGGRSASARDARTVDLLDGTIALAAAKRTAPPIAETSESHLKNGSEKIALAAAEPQHAAPAIGSTDPIKPNAVKTLPVQIGAMQTASLEPDAGEGRKLVHVSGPTKMTTVNVRREVVAPLPLAKPDVPAAQDKLASNGTRAATAEPEPAGKSHNGWMIQVGAFPEEKDAKRRLAAAQGKAKAQLSKADPFTERIEKGKQSLYRARFAGLDKGEAEQACRHLKRSDIPCMLVRN